MTHTDDPVDVAADTADAGVGTVAEEAVKLLGALSGWAKENGDGWYDGLQDGLSSIADELHEHVSTGTPECTWCPVCRTVAAVRQASPEVKAHLSTAASSLMLAVSGLMSTRPPARGAGHDGGSGVERITLDDDLDDWSAADPDVSDAEARPQDAER